MRDDERFDILARLRSRPRDDAEWTRFIHQHYAPVMYTAMKWTGGERELSKEISQEAFTRFIEGDSIQQVESEEHALAILRQIARRMAIDVHRRNRRVPTVNYESVEVTEQLVASRQGDEFVQRDLLQLAEMLNPQEKELLELTLLGLNTGEIARHLGITYSATAMRLNRMRKSLKIKSK